MSFGVNYMAIDLRTGSEYRCSSLAVTSVIADLAQDFLFKIGCQGSILAYALGCLRQRGPLPVLECTYRRSIVIAQGTKFGITQHPQLSFRPELLKPFENMSSGCRHRMSSELAQNLNTRPYGSRARLRLVTCASQLVLECISP